MRVIVTTFIKILSIVRRSVVKSVLENYKLIYKRKKRILVSKDTYNSCLARFLKGVNRKHFIQSLKSIMSYSLPKTVYKVVEKELPIPYLCSVTESLVSFGVGSFKR